jgi:hypothetical protein
MFKYVIGVLTLQRLGLARPLRLTFLVIFGLLAIVVAIYTANLFLTLNEKVSAPHVHTPSHH